MAAAASAPGFARIGDFLAHHAARDPDREAMVFDMGRTSYRALLEGADRLAAALIASGVRKGDRVALLSTPRPEYFTLHMAAARIGAVFLGLNPRHKPGEMLAVLQDARPRLLFALAGFEGRDFRAGIGAIAAACGSIERVVIFGGEAPTGMMGLAAYLETSAGTSAAVLEAAVRAVAPEDPLAIVYSSGSTGRRKGAVLTHRNFAAVYSRAAEIWRATPLRQINNYPIDHIGCIGDVATCNLVAGGTQIFMERFDAGASLAAIEREGITVWGQEVAMFQRAVAHETFARTDFSSLQLIWWAGAPAPASLVDRLLSTGARLSTCWGMSETCGPVTFAGPTRDRHALIDNVGRPAPGFRIELCDAGGAPVPAGEVGEIRIAGDCVMAGYFNRPEETRATLGEDGRLRTGDLARARADGALALVGRMTEMYKSGGYNIYPREIELALEAHPAVALVAVVRAPDPDWQEVGHAFLLPRAGGTLDPAALESWCRERLANYKVPKRFWVRAELPLLASGKIDRKALEAEAAASVAAAARGGT